MNIYKAINKQTVCLGQYKIVPIRFEDRYSILEWRNEQMYHLRQKREYQQKGLLYCCGLKPVKPDQ